MAVMLDQAQILHASMEKKAKQFDRIVTEWKAKVRIDYRISWSKQFRLVFWAADSFDFEP
jgi:hypothetical protein